MVCKKFVFFEFFFAIMLTFFKSSLIEHVERMWNLLMTFQTPRVCRLSATAMNELVGVF